MELTISSLGKRHRSSETEAGHFNQCLAFKIERCNTMRVKINNGVFCLVELGYCFFHNGTHLLKISKKNFLAALESDEKSARLANIHPDFFNMAEASEARCAYERSTLSFRN